MWCFCKKFWKSWIENWVSLFLTCTALYWREPEFSTSKHYTKAHRRLLSGRTIWFVITYCCWALLAYYIHVHQAIFAYLITILFGWFDGYWLYCCYKVPTTGVLLLIQITHICHTSAARYCPVARCLKRNKLFQCPAPPLQGSCCTTWTKDKTKQNFFLNTFDTAPYHAIPCRQQCREWGSWWGGGGAAEPLEFYKFVSKL